MERRDGSRMTALRDRALLAAQAFAVFAGLILLAYAVNGIPAVTVVHGASMEPGISQGDAYGCVPGWSAGDVVVLQDPTRDRLLVKRAIAEGPCMVTIDGDGNVSVDGILLDEPYAQGRRPDKAGTWDVPAGQVFVLGDNRGVSMDSRDFGPVPSGSVKCRAAFYIGHCTDMDGTDDTDGTEGIE